MIRTAPPGNICPMGRPLPLPLRRPAPEVAFLPRGLVDPFQRPGPPCTSDATRPRSCWRWAPFGSVSNVLSMVCLSTFHCYYHRFFCLRRFSGLNEPKKLSNIKKLSIISPICNKNSILQCLTPNGGLGSMNRASPSGHGRAGGTPLGHRAGPIPPPPLVPSVTSTFHISYLPSPGKL